MGEPSTSSSQPPPPAGVRIHPSQAPTASHIGTKTSGAASYGIPGVDVQSALSAPRIPAELTAGAGRVDADEVSGSLTLGEPPRGASWRPRESLPVYSRYGRFELLGRLARGGMAEILLARERALGGAYRHVVVKRILPQSAEDQDYVKMFLAEGRLMMGLSHPNICHVYDVGQDGPTWFIAMEWVHGESLIKVIRRARNRGVGLPPALAARTIADIASALHSAHVAKDASGRPLGIVHRDVSPHNIMVTYDGAVKLLDFGIAKVNASSEHTTTGVVKGKFAYMPPEQCLGRDLDARADVFALGVCLYEALTGRSLYRRENEYATLRAVIKEPVPSVRAVDPRIPVVLDRIVATALQKNREDRFESAQAMQLCLEKYLADERQMVSSALVGRMMRRLFEEELRAGPSLEPIVAVHVAEEPAVETPSASSEELTPKARSGPIAALMLIVATLLGAAALVAQREGVLRVDAPQVTVAADHVDAPPPVAAADATSAQPALAPPEPAEAGEAIAASTASPPERREREAVQFGTLSLNTHPWSRVYHRGRLLGTTPLGAVRVPSGRLRLRFEDRDGRVHHHVLRIRPGEREERFIELR